VRTKTMRTHRYASLRSYIARVWRAKPWRTHHYVSLGAQFGAIPLRIKWIAALTATSLIGIALSSALVGMVTMREFDRLMIDQAQEGIVDSVLRYYTDSGSLDGFAQAMRFPIGIDLPLEDTIRLEVDRRDLPPQMLTRTALMPGIVLTDADGRVVIADSMYPIGQPLPADAAVFDRQVIVSDEIVIGAIAFIGGAPTLDPREQLYITSTREALLFGALAAVGASVLVGMVLSGALLRPLRALTGAARRMGAGDLVQRVEVRSRDEIGALATAFNHLSDRLAQSQALRVQMTADIAHELRSPLTVISGTLEGLRDGVLKPTPARFETLFSEAGQLGRLIDELRTLSLADAGELRLNRTGVSPVELLTSAEAAFRPGAEARGVTIDLCVPPTIADVSIDRERVSQVLANLIGNAIRYARARIALSVEARDGGALLRVTDDGAGIASDKLPFIFERFYRADESRDDGSGGSGLGLAIARSIVTAHGGTITADSTVGVGTTIAVWLPEQSHQS